MRLASIALSLAFAGTAFCDDKPAPLTANNANDLRQQYDRQMKDFADTIEKLKDNPEAKEALEKARDEFKKGMEEKLKEADAAIPPGRERGGFGRAQLVIPNFPQPVLPQGNLLPMQDLQQELLNERMNALRAMNGMNPFLRSSGRFGMQLATVPAVLVEQMGLEKNVGVVLAAVAKDSAADKAGLKTNDILLQLDGKNILSEPGQLSNQLARAKEGEKISFLVLRKGKKEKVEGLVVPAEHRRGEAIPPRGSKGFRMSIVNGEATLNGTFEGGVEITSTGAIEAGKFVPSKIIVKDGEEKIEAENVEKVPEKYRGRVEKLLGNVGAR